MHEMRNFLLVLMILGAVLWGGVAWFVLSDEAAAVGFQRATSIFLLIGAGLFLAYALLVEDKLPDHLAEIVGQVYYEADGLSFMPMVRMRDGEAELCVYYQNRFENPVQAIIHLRPPKESFIIREGMRDVHFAFKVAGGDFGAIHQPIAVPAHLQGDVINVQLAAASWYPMSHGSCLRKHCQGMPCGSLNVDWGGAAFKAGVHESSGEIELMSPVTLHLPMPKGVRSEVGAGTWRQEQLAADEVEQVRLMHHRA